ncbi:Hsp70 family protein [Mycobacterium europaeum]|uniref:Hsp70 family protein n=1 Tax=Mycobacterium europaeum TaxID=761804 RepID=UPI002ADFC377|nr:Hsp70 family protein [Mycobacterium europaeum]MEA1158411.1 Hsp70 family protein [Mycobacterium europaeum]
MSTEARRGLGLSAGTANLAAITADRAVTRTSVLTLYQHRPPEVGVPAENPRLDEPGLVITDFVDRVGDPVGIVAADGSTHRGEALLADALRALAYAATAGQPLPEATAVAYPAHWRPAAVDALRTALSRVPEWSGGSESLSLISDAEGALTALQTNPGLPIRGIVAVCDFGAGGTSITLVDAANGYQPIGATVRHTDFSGELIDQALLAHIVADLSSAGSIDVSATSAIGSLTRLRAECRAAKQRLSASTATTLPADLPGFRGNIRLTRIELNEAINQPLDQLVHVLQDTLARNGIRATDLVAIASVGGGAAIPEVTARLSERFRVPVTTPPRPHLAAATGAALRAARGPADNSETKMAAAAVVAAPPPLAEPTLQDVAPVSTAMPALAWSEAGDESGVLPPAVDEFPGRAGDDAKPPSAAPPFQFGDETGYARPDLRFEQQPLPDEARPADTAWYRRPVVLVLAAAAAVLALSAVIMLALSHGSTNTPVAPKPGATTTPQPSPPPSTVQTNPAPAQQAPVETSTAAPAPPPASAQPAPTTTEPPPTTTEPPPTTTEPPPPSSASTATTSPPAPPPPSSTDNPPPSVQVPQIPRIPRIPAIPAIPPIP